MSDIRNVGKMLSKVLVVLAILAVLVAVGIVGSSEWGLYNGGVQLAGA